MFYNIRLLLLIILTSMLHVAFSQDSTVVKNTVRRSIFEKGDINGNVVYQTGRISDFGTNSDGSINYQAPVYRVRNTLGINFGVRLFELVYLRTSLYYSLNRKINSPWATTDYTYVLERVKWDRNSFSYGYNNYAANKFDTRITNFGDNFLRGVYYVRYYNLFPRNWLKAMHADTTLDLSYSVSLKYAIKYLDNENVLRGNVFDGKPTINFALRQTIFRNFYIEGAIEYYLRSETKTNWDPDFTYAFGYNTYSHLSLGVTYANYNLLSFAHSREICWLNN